MAEAMTKAHFANVFLNMSLSFPVIEKSAKTEHCPYLGMEHVSPCSGTTVRRDRNLFLQVLIHATNVEYSYDFAF
ncbi:MAG: hypothetical protein LBT71_03975 [Azoarcus sp.]|jgi:hypothetical protein|nr:hypothetical protein [Azoarcus sp.]